MNMRQFKALVEEAYENDLVSWSGDENAAAKSPYWVSTSKLKAFVEFVIEEADNGRLA